MYVFFEEAIPFTPRTFRSRGFSPLQNGSLDLRFDRDTNPSAPTASQMLKFIDEFSLRKILTYYGGMKEGKLITNAILEARHGFTEIHKIDVSFLLLAEEPNTCQKSIWSFLRLISLRFMSRPPTCYFIHVYPGTSF
jgi:hypothetical protein